MSSLKIGSYVRYNKEIYKFVGRVGTRGTITLSDPVLDDTFIEANGSECQYIHADEAKKIISERMKKILRKNAVLLSNLK